MASVELTKPEISIRIIKCVFVYFEQIYGREKLEEVLNEVGDLNLEYLSNESNWVSFCYLRDSVDRLVEESGDPDFSYKAGLFQSRPEVMPVARAFVRALGSPRTMYEFLFGVAADATRVNRVGTFEILDITGNSLTVGYKPSSKDYLETNHNLHNLRRGQIGSLTRLFGLPAAEVMLDDRSGQDGMYVYRVKWVDTQGRYFKRWGRRFATIGGAVGVAAMAAIFWVRPEAWWTGALFAVCALCLGFVLGKLAEANELLTYKEERIEDAERNKKSVQEQILVQDSQIREKAEALQAANLNLEKRNADLEVAKETLEDRVEERTRELAQRNQELKDAYELKERFFATINHELRTPLTLILTPLESLLNNDGLTDRQRTSLETMHSNSRRLLKLINDLLDLSSFGAKKIRLSYRDLDVNQAIERVINSVKPTAENAQLELATEMGVELPKICADAARIEQVLLNLLSNAIKFTESGGRITVSSFQDGEFVCLQVRDTGQGIAKELQANIFDRFSVGGSQAIRGYGGTGLGLSLVKEIVTLHGGDVVLESDLGEGTTFTVMMPQGTDHVREELKERRRNNSFPVPVSQDQRKTEKDYATDHTALHISDMVGHISRGGEIETPQHRPGLRTILLVDDREEMLELLVSELGNSHNLLLASNGDEGVQTAIKHLPDLILSDVMMPVKNGYELCEELKAYEPTKEIPIILLSAKAEEEHWAEGDIAVAAAERNLRAEGIERGADDFLTKPFGTRELNARIVAQLTLKDMAKELREINGELSRANTDLEISLARQTELATTDHLTGLLNRREFDHRLNEAFERAVERDKSIAVVMFDIDFFRSINNNFGHPAGDLVLTEIARDSKLYTKEGFAGRYGGEEFIFCFPAWTQAQAAEWAEGLRKYVADQVYLPEYPEHQITISMGVSAIPDQNAANCGALVKMADEALYLAKNGGRNQVRQAASSVSEAVARAIEQQDNQNAPPQ